MSYTETEAGTLASSFNIEAVSCSQTEADPPASSFNIEAVPYTQTEACTPASSFNIEAVPYTQTEAGTLASSFNIEAVSYTQTEADTLASSFSMCVCVYMSPYMRSLYQIQPQQKRSRMLLRLFRIFCVFLLSSDNDDSATSGNGVSQAKVGVASNMNSRRGKTSEAKGEVGGVTQVKDLARKKVQATES